jgi:formylmethanofuran dehydrogenase subunit A
MFAAASHVFKDGELVVRDGEVVKERWGKALTVDTPAVPHMDRRMQGYYEDAYGVPASLFQVPEHAIGREQPFGRVPCASS